MHGNFEVVALEGNNLAHYWHNNTTGRWTRFRNISTRATGVGCIFQSDFGARDHKNFEAIVPEASLLAHYFDDNRLT